MTEQNVSKIEERRQRAREAFADALESGERFTAASEEAIETATRVKITDDAEQAAIEAYGAQQITGSMYAAIAAALAELGFEVES